MKPQRIEISYKTIVFTFAFVLGLLLLWQIRSILILLFVSLVFMEAINPTVNRLQRAGLPRVAGIILVYIFVVLLASIAVAGIIPILVQQTSGLLQVLPSILQDIRFMGFNAIDLSSQFRLLETIPSEIARTVISLFSNIFNGFVILVITFYLLIERSRLDDYAARIFGRHGQIKVRNIFDELEIRLGNWVNGQLVLMTVIGILSYLGYGLIGLNYALPLALIAGLLEIVPNIGPFVATALAGLVGLSTSPLVALLAIIWGIIIQQAENNFIVPKIMRTAVGIHPVITILTIATGGTLAGVAGALLAVPVYITIETVVKAFYTKNAFPKIDKPDSV